MFNKCYPKNRTYNKLLIILPIVLSLSFNALAQAKLKPLSQKEEEQLLQKLEKAGKLNAGFRESVMRPKDGTTIPMFVLVYEQKKYWVSAELINKISPRFFGNVNALKGIAATNAYGKEGKNGVMVITMNE